MADLKLFLLGAPRVELAGKTVDLNRRKVMAPLIYLAVTRQRHRRDTLATLFWPESNQATARASLRRELYTLTSALGNAWLLTDRESLALATAAPIWVDVEAFRTNLAGWRAHGHQAEAVCDACVAQLTTAVALYQGDFLAGFTLSDCPEFDDWQFFQAESLRRELASALAKLVRVHSGRAEYTTAIGYARRWLALDPLHEPIHRELMQLYALAEQPAAALRQYQECARLLHEELGVPTEDATIALFEAIRTKRFPAHPKPTKEAAGWDHLVTTRPVGRSPVSVHAMPVIPNNLPAQTTLFIGREKELAAVIRLLLDEPTCRLLTLLGPGGIGKTRLAQEAATNLRKTFPDGVWLVELAPLTDPALVPQTVASILGMPETADTLILSTLSRYLRTKHLLILLDNCEHLIDACAHLADTLLRACPQVCLLATSRETLGIAGEATFAVPSLFLPDRKHLPAIDLLAQYEAVRLFIERAKAVLPDFRLTTTNAAAVAQVCCYLDGIPLAIELAAARVRMLRVEQIADRLNDRFRLLTSGSRTARPRHQTLRALIDWSYDLLADAERCLFHALAVFAGGWTLAAAEAVCTVQVTVNHAHVYASATTGSASFLPSPLDVFDLLSQLVNKSLIVADRKQGEETRYRLLETIRQYAREKLVETGGDVYIRRQHLAYFCALAAQAAQELRGPHQVTWLDRLEAEHDNLRGALEWALVNDVTAALQLASALLWFWHIRGHKREGREWLARALTAEAQSQHPHPSGTVPRTARAKALHVAGFLAHMTGEVSVAHSLAQESLALFMQLGAAGLQGGAYALLSLGSIAVEQGQHAQGKPLLEKALLRFRQVDDKFGIAETLSSLSNIALAASDYELARTLREEQLALRRVLGDQDGLADALSNLGLLAFGLGDYRRARALWEESLVGFDAVGNRWAMGFTFYGLGEVARAEGDYALAIQKHEAGLAFGYDIGDKHVIARAQYELGIVAWSQGNYTQAVQRYTEALALMRELGNTTSILKTLYALGEVTYALADYGQARHWYEELLTMSRSMSDNANAAAAQYGLGKIAYVLGDYTTAVALLKEAIVQWWHSQAQPRILWQREVRNPRGIPCFLEALAVVATAQQQMSAAAFLFGATDAWHTAVRFMRSPLEHTIRERDVNAVRATLGERGFMNAWTAGRERALAQVIDYVLTEESAFHATPPH